MISWPSTLPQTALLEFEGQERAGLVDPDEVRNPQRLRTYPEREADFVINVNGTQLAAFRAFWETTLNQTAPFSCPWLADCGYTFHFARFRETPSWKLIGPNLWAVALPLEIIAGVEVDSDGDPAIYLPEES